MTMPIGLDRCSPFPPRTIPPRSNIYRLRQSLAVMAPYEMHLVTYQANLNYGRSEEMAVLLSAKFTGNISAEKFPALRRCLLREFSLPTLTPYFNSIKVTLGEEQVRAVFSWQELVHLCEFLLIELPDIGAAPIIVKNGRLQLASRDFEYPSRTGRRAIARFLRNETISPPAFFAIPNCDGAIHFCDDAMGEPCFIALPKKPGPDTDHFVQLTFSQKGYVLRLYRRGHSSVQLSGVIRGEIDPETMDRIIGSWRNRAPK